MLQSESDKTNLNEQLKANENIRDTLEAEVKTTTSKSEELNNQLTKLALEKESFQDELFHMRTEVEELRGHLERVSNLNATMNKDKNELTVKGDSMVKDVDRLQRQLSSALSEKAKLIGRAIFWFKILQPKLLKSEI